MRTTTVLIVCLLGFVVAGQAANVSSTAKPSTAVPSAEEVDDETRFEEPVADGGSVLRTLGRETAHKPTSHDLLMKEKTEHKAPVDSVSSETADSPSTVTEKKSQQSGVESSADVVPNRYSNAVEAPLIEDGAPSKNSSAAELAVRSTTVKVRGASRQFGATPQVAPFTSDLMLSDQHHKSYENYRVYRVLVDSRKHEQYLASLESDVGRNVTLWEDPIVDRNVTLIVPPLSVKSVQEEFDSKALKYSVLTENLKQWLDEEMKGVNPSLFLEQKSLENFKLNTYHSFDEISSYLDLLVKQYPNLLKPVKLGYTYERNPIQGVVLSTGGQKRAIYMDAATHAREWISTASLLYVLSKMVSTANTDPDVKSLLDRYEFHFIPVLNADGYKYTWSGDRLWRKNRVRFEGFSWCLGVDPNRNFDYYWGGEGASANPCSDVYRGSSAFSELESRAVRDYIGSMKNRLSLYLSLHAYGQYFLLPYGTGPSMISTRNNEQMAAAAAFRDAVYRKSGLTYKIGASKQALYAASGLSNDWVHSQGVTHAYVAELRDTGAYGFVLPPSQILPAAEELFEGLKALVSHIAASDLKTVS